MKRPKSALIINIPVSFLEHSDAKTVKDKFKKCFETFDLKSQILDRNNTKLLIDRGPSLFNQKFTSYNKGKFFKDPNKKAKPSRKLNRISINHLKQNMKVIDDDTNRINQLLSKPIQHLNINSATLFKDLQSIILRKGYKKYQRSFHSALR